MSVWGGPKGQKKIPVILGSMGFIFTGGLMVMGMARTLLVWAIAGLIYGFFLSVGNTLIFALWQQKVDPALQGRVFNTLRIVGLASTPVAVLLATQLSDKIFEPAMTGGGALASLFGTMVGTAQGSGMGLVLTFSGLFGVLAMLGGFLWPAVRNAETMLPDHNEAA